MKTVEYTKYVLVYNYVGTARTRVIDRFIRLCRAKSDTEGTLSTNEIKGK